MWRSLVFLALLASAQGRAVNISNTWVLPEEGFPVFYRYFRDRISWYEADAVCQFHHANLVTVDTTAQYDAVRAYLKELDISSAVWVGLIRSNPDGDFTWTDYRGLSGDGYWSSAPDTRSAPLCAAANPVADYRWEARACGGPTVASFICELPVPQWALGSEGCMVRELPALTILYLPESAAVQLNADCGLAGVKRVQCTGNVKREGLLKDLTCADEEEISSTSTGTNWPPTTDNTADPDTASEAITEENTTTEHEVDINEPIVITATLLPQYINSKTQYKSLTKFTDMDNFNTDTFGKNVNLGENDDNNIQSNFIPQLVDEDHILANEQFQKLEDERHMQHKMLHEEIARVGNVDNIFTQPTDHFIPPLVMAKSRMSDDMTVLSLAEKHAQQVAEKQFGKHSEIEVEVNNNNTFLLDSTQSEKPLITSVKSNKVKETKLNNLKSHVPKKYGNEKYYDSKDKVTKILQSKTTEINNILIDATKIPTIIQEDKIPKSHSHYQDKIGEDFAMDLTVMLKDTPFTSEKGPSPSNSASDMANLESVTKHEISLTNTSDITTTQESFSPLPNINTVNNNTMEHEVIQITVISNDDPTVNTSVFEITTKMPIFRDDTEKSNVYSTSFPTIAPKETQNTETIETIKLKSTSKDSLEVSTSDATIVPVTQSITNITEEPILINVTTEHILPTTETTIITTKAEVIPTLKPSIKNKTEIPEISTTMNTTPFFNISDEVTVDDIDKVAIDNLSADSHNDSTPVESNVSLETDLNNTEVNDLAEKNVTDTEEIDDNSPLLSGAYEPVHRPPRTRRPQQQNRKFNPFRILG